MNLLLFSSFISVLLLSFSYAAPQTPKEADDNNSTVQEIINELKKLGKISDDEELPDDLKKNVETIRIVEDPSEIEKIISKELSNDGDVIEDFQPISLPSDFCEYDVDGNGYIDRSELLQVTGAVENMDLAFNESDVNGDNLLDEAEFSMAPWNLGVNMTNSTFANSTSAVDGNYTGSGIVGYEEPNGSQSQEIPGSLYTDSGEGYDEDNLSQESDDKISDEYYEDKSNTDSPHG